MAAQMADISGSYDSQSEHSRADNKTGFYATASTHAAFRGGTKNQGVAVRLKPPTGVNTLLHLAPYTSTFNLLYQSRYRLATANKRGFLSLDKVMVRLASLLEIRPDQHVVNKLSLSMISRPESGAHHEINT